MSQVKQTHPSPKAKKTAAYVQIGEDYGNLPIKLKPVSKYMDQNDGYKTYYRTSVYEKIEFIRNGIYPNEIKNLSDILDIPQKELLKALNISQATLSRKASNQTPLSSSDTERALGLAKIIGFVEDMVSQSDRVDFKAAQWVGLWLKRPHPALGGLRPLEFLDTIDGQSYLMDLLGKQQSGAYA